MKTEQYLRRALRGFREENQTLEQFLAVLIGIKRIDEPVKASSLLTVLKAENAANPLPTNIYDGVNRWIRINSDDGESLPPLSDNNAVRDNNVVDIPSPKHPANINREFRKHKARVLNNRYVLIKVIDSSFIGTVYKAIDLRKQEADIPEPYVAIKILKRTFRAHQDWLTTYYNEVQKRQWLTHPNITKVLGLDRDASTVFIIMEYILGESLAHALNFDDLRQNLIQEGRLLPTIDGMGEALAFAHKRGIIHGNFKPSKVLLTKDDAEIKVFDFSIECALSDIDAADPTLELESPLVETRIYASPEVLEYETPDPRDDVYALACTTYELLTGLHPFNREISTVARNAGIKVKLHSGMDRKQWKALRHALAFERNKRTASVSQFLAEFSGTHSARTTSWLRYAAGIAAIAATAGIALSYHFLKLEQVQVAQVENDRYDIPIPPLPNSASTKTPAAHTDKTEAKNIQPTEEVVEINAAMEPPVATSRALATNETSPQSGMAPHEESQPPPQGLQTDTSSTPTPPAIEATDKSANTPDTAESIQRTKVNEKNTQTTSLSIEEEKEIDREIQRYKETEKTSLAPTAIFDTNNLEASQQEQISELMTQAEQQRTQRRLTIPAGANALETYQEVLALNSGYEPALKGIEDIKVHFKNSSQRAYGQGNLAQAKTELQKAIAIDPKDPSLKENLIVLQKALKADQAARDIEQKVSALLAKTQQQMAEQRLTQPPGNNAWETLNKIIQIDPQNKKANEGLDALAGELESRAVDKQQAGDIDAALVIADEGLRIRSNDPELLALRSELSYQAHQKSQALLAEKQLMDSNIVENGTAEGQEMPPQQADEGAKPRRFRAGGTF
jgi:serine/threonine protein kinase